MVLDNINYKGYKYQIDENYWESDMLNTTPQFQHEQLLYCIEIGDYQTLENRISNMLKWGGIIQIK